MVVGAVVAGCVSTQDDAAGAPDEAREDATVATETEPRPERDGGADAVPPAPPEPEPVTLSEAEVYPNAKRFAAAVAQRLTTYDLDTNLTSLAATVADGDADVLEGLVAAAAPLHHEDAWSRGEIVYAQLGGVRADAASVMVVVEQTIGTSAGTRVETRTLDVRLRLVDDEWAFARLTSAGGQPPIDPPSPTEEAAAVLNDDRIALPDSARWDILAGGIDPALLRLMTRIAERTPYAVGVLSSGHPVEVFGTDRQSNHTKGNAVDVYRLDGRDVIDDRADGSSTDQLVTWLFDEDTVSELGSPWALDGFGGRSFTDVVHADHLHIGVGGRSPMEPGEG
jgi:hypothetical protein